MSSLLKFEWTVLNGEPPAIRRPCSRCGTATSFSSTGKFRLNANGRRLDAWLIYRCRSCDKRWNRPIFERRSVDSIPEEELAAFQSNDPVLADRIAQDACPGSHPENGNMQAAAEALFYLDMRMTGQGRGRREGQRDETLLVIRNPDRNLSRLDRILASGLGISRKKLQHLCETGGLDIREVSAKVPETAGFR